MSRDNQKPTGWQLPESQQATLLDLMAMSALQGILVAEQSLERDQWISAEAAAGRAYDCATAMMAERAKRMGVSHE